MHTADIKQELRNLADQLPEDATWKDVAYEAYVRQEIAAGLEETRHGKFTSGNEVRDTFAKRGVQIETEAA
jgi:predicted transcriptional regulator